MCCRFQIVTRWQSTAKEPEKTQSPEASIKDLPSEKEGKRTVAAKWMSDKLDQLQTTIFTAGKTLNDVTGYTAIEKLKDQIEAQEKEIHAKREEVRLARDAYSTAVERRLSSQREVNELLQRKNAWSGSDLERFTTLIRDDHANEMAVKEANGRTESLEQALEDARGALFRLIGSRYREEQIWSDKIRRASTYGTWGLMAFNVLLFLVVQLGLEPWKRRRLVGSFEQKVEEALDKMSFTELATKLESLTVPVPVPAAEPVAEKTIDPTLTAAISESKGPSYASRVVRGFEDRTSILITPSEWAATTGVATATGLVLGALCALVSTRGY